MPALTLTPTPLPERERGTTSFGKITVKIVALQGGIMV